MRLRRCSVAHPVAALRYPIFENAHPLKRGLSGASTEIALVTLACNVKRALAVLGGHRMRKHLA